MEEIKKFILKEKNPIFDKESDVLIGNGVTIAFLSNDNQYKNHYIFKKFNDIYQKIKNNFEFKKCLNKIFTTKQLENIINNYEKNENFIETFISKTFKSFSFLRDWAEYNNYDLIKSLQSSYKELTDYYIENMVERLKDFSDFEAWFFYIDLYKIGSRELSLRDFEIENLNRKKQLDHNLSNYKKSPEYKIYLKYLSLPEVKDLLEQENFIKSVIVFWILNYKNNQLISINYLPSLDENQINLKNNLKKVKSIMTLNYDNFLENILEKQNIHHLHGRLSKIILNGEIVNIKEENFINNFKNIVENIFIASFPGAKLSQTYSPLLYVGTEEFLWSGQLNINYPEARKKTNELLEKNSNWKNEINFLLKEKSICELTTNKRIIVLGVKPKSDMSYLIKIFKNYEEIYIGYYSPEDVENAKKIPKWLNDILEKYKDIRKDWDLINIRRKVKSNPIIYIFNTYKVTKIGNDEFKNCHSEFTEKNKKFICVFPTEETEIKKMNNIFICKKHENFYSDYLESFCDHCENCTCPKCDEKYYGGIPCEICGQYKW